MSDDHPVPSIVEESEEAIESQVLEFIPNGLEDAIVVEDTLHLGRDPAQSQKSLLGVLLVADLSEARLDAGRLLVRSQLVLQLPFSLDFVSHLVSLTAKMSTPLLR